MDLSATTQFVRHLSIPDNSVWYTAYADKFVCDYVEYVPISETRPIFALFGNAGLSGK